MPPPQRSRPLSTRLFPITFQKLKPVVLTEAARTVTPNTIPPNIRSISWSPTGTSIATSTGANVRIWNPDKPQLKSSTELRNTGGVLEKIAFCPAHEALLASTGSGDSMLKLWDLRSPGGASLAGKKEAVGECKLGDQGWSLTWHPRDMGILVGTRNDAVEYVDVRMPDQKWEMEMGEMMPSAKSASLNGMAFSNGGHELFVTTVDGPVKIYDWPSMQLLHTLSCHTTATYCAAQSPAGDFMAIGGGDSLLTLWDTCTWHCAHAIMSETSAVRELSFSFDGSYIVAGGGTEAKDGDKGLDVHHVETGEKIFTVETTKPVTCVAWHPLRYWIAYTGEPGGLCIVGPGGV